MACKYDKGFLQYFLCFSIELTPKKYLWFWINILSHNVMKYKTVESKYKQ